MSFECPIGSPLFVASIGDANAAFLDGETEIGPPSLGRC
ncbi:hypothetical protein AZE42_13302 [Rhizopogon vesiculosus]|uniref:Uncharacterized protein n=1 Tax=Rhizopogon vesiculosus TaxID=180088 RepID=A0A1J8Q4F5_9AGAM|nr:hypothetical protein AZE42_13302 [Rhizopogon vesiculosus]